MSKKNLLLLLSITCIQLLSAQNLPSTLLWKISGNGLQKASYLYGTMHLTDERIFDIGDSVYKAIENSDGFATEIDPEQFTPFVIDEAKKWYMASVRLKEMMSHEEFKKYGKPLAKKLNKNENDITAADVLREKNNWISESYRTGKMQTFLDVYLFDIARRQGKWTGGVEDLQDQEDVMNLIDESDIQELAADENENESDKNKEYKRSSELFIKSYINNDLDAIDSLSFSGDSLYEDALLIKRNKKMAMRMDSLGHERSMMFAVGAAHLPGNEGLIALLKQKGFTVTPVFSSKKIKPKDYKVAEITLPWYDVKDEAGLYNASMPGKPGDLTLYGIITMKMYFDAFKSTIYMTTALKTPYSQSMADSVLSRITSYYFGMNDYTKGKPITLNNTLGREFFSTKNNYSHGYLLFKDGTMYMAIAMSMKKDSSAASSINQFLHSFTINEHSANNDANTVTYINKMKAYQVNVPVQPKPAGDLASAYKDSTLNKEINIVNDPASGAYLFFGTNEAARGFFIENDSSTLTTIKESQKEKFKHLDIDTTYTKNSHRILEYGGMMVQVPLMMKVHYESRGNRWYALVAMYDPEKAHASVESFFNSFTILDYAETEWNNYTSTDKLFSTWAPGQFILSAKPSAKGDTIYNNQTYDTARADNYAIVATGFGKYYWQNSDSVLWSDLIEKSTEYDDSLLLKKAISNGEAKGYEIEIQESGSGNIKRKRMLLNGGKIYSLITIQAAAEINNANNNKFFEEFRFNNLQPTVNIFVSKAAILLKDISSDDSAVRSQATEYLSKAPFTKSELPFLHDALLKNYPKDEDDYDETKNDLKKIIIDLNDTSSYNFAKNNYAKADDDTKNILLAVMASFPTQENFNDIKNILLKQPPRITPGYDLINSLSDTLQLTAAIFPELLPLMKDTIMAPVIIKLSNKLLNRDYADKTLLQPYQQDVLQIAQKKYTVAKNDADSYDELNYPLIDLLGKMNTAETNAMLQKWSLLKDIYIQMEAVGMLLQNKQPVNPLAIKALTADNSTRIELYDSLKAYKKENLFPAQYLTQKYFAKSHVYTAASDDEDPDKLTYLTQKIINFKGRQSRFYFYKVTYGDSDDASYSLACAGPFHMNVSDVSEDAAGDIYYDEEFDASNLPAQMDALIKQMEEWYEWKDEKK